MAEKVLAAVRTGAEQDRNPRISHAGRSGGRRPNEDGSRRHLRHRRQALRGSADRRADHHGPREYRLSSPRPAANSPAARASRKATSSSSSTMSCAASASGATAANTAIARTPTGAPIRTPSATATPQPRKPPHLWGGFAQYIYLPWNAVRAPCARRASRRSSRASSRQWRTASNGRCSTASVGYNSTVLIQGPGQQGLSQTVICKQAGASLIIVTGTAKDGARLKVAKELGADYVIDVQQRRSARPDHGDHRRQGRRRVTRLHRRRRHHPDPARHRGAQAQGRHHRRAGGNGAVPEFPAGEIHGEVHHHEERRAATAIEACELALAQIASNRFPLEKVTTHRFGLEGCRSRHPLGRGKGVPDVIHASLMPWLDS